MKSTGAAQNETASEDAGLGTDAKPRSVCLAVDLMGGDHGPGVAIEGLERMITRSVVQPGDSFLLFGEEAGIAPLLAKSPNLAQRARIINCTDSVPMNARAADALRNGRDTSMWRALDTLAQREADAVISMGNTGALMAMATIRVKRAPGVSRPAIAALWPSVGPLGATVVLDMGADLKADATLLRDYAIMGVEYARIVLDLDRPRVGLLNVGAEETKGRVELREAADMLTDICLQPGREPAPDAYTLKARFVGFVEGDQIAANAADVVVTDGFSGNIALKTAEGIAKLVGGFLKETLQGSPAGKLAGLLLRPSLRRLMARMDPRRVNGGVFLGLNGLVVKSHGGADAVGFEAAASLAIRVARGDIAGRVASEVAKLDRPPVERDDASVGMAAGTL